jgi:hypothetical protein
VDVTRRCGYCGAPLEGRRTVACCDQHARKLAYARRATGEWFKRWAERIRRAAEGERVRKDRWRDVAMGRNAEEQLHLIFNRKGNRK